MSKKTDKTIKFEQQISELTEDLQRSRADFDNYRKRTDEEKKRATEIGESRAVMKMLPVIDTIERAVQHLPEDISDHPWVQGVGGLIKQLDKSLASMDLKRIEASEGVKFDPEIHQAVQFDEDAVGETEVILEEMQAGYTLKGETIRPAMVKVTRK